MISLIYCKIQYLYPSMLFLVNGAQSLYVNQGCLKCISGINLSPVNKSFLILHSFYTFKKGI